MPKPGGSAPASAWACTTVVAAGVANTPAATKRAANLCTVSDDRLLDNRAVCARDSAGRDGHGHDGVVGHLVAADARDDVDERATSTKRHRWVRNSCGETRQPDHVRGSREDRAATGWNRVARAVREVRGRLNAGLPTVQREPTTVVRHLHASNRAGNRPRCQPKRCTRTGKRDGAWRVDADAAGRDGEGGGRVRALRITDGACGVGRRRDEGGEGSGHRDRDAEGK